ncbi:MAG: quinone-dependent dihydroorotate dehydrogenase [Candidatus Dadabacteria bacterium]|nr:MAG: quinone-dependent dihydroorotate dehydrogenase [Candidatus Dadabacteria bacterium]
MEFYRVIREHLLFKLDPETAHNAFISSQPLIKFFLPALPLSRYDNLKRDYFGLSFSHPLGLAAGFDKDARALELLAKLGFSHIEIGTVTPRPQAGNPRPRIFRYPQNQALINRMGFPSAGADVVEKQLKSFSSLLERPVLGINIGKNKETPNERAVYDYLEVFKQLYLYGDYFVVNVSSPNTPGLRELQAKTSLGPIIAALQEANPKRKPVLVKLSPDLNMNQLEEVVECCIENSVSGIIATNTTLAREGLQTAKMESGGLSGRPLFERSLKCVQAISKITAGRVPVIAVGGIFNGMDLDKMLSAGAVLAQIYTAFIYRGPYVVKRILDEYLSCMVHKEDNS